MEIVSSVIVVMRLPISGLIKGPIGSKLQMPTVLLVAMLIECYCLKNLEHLTKNNNDRLLLDFRRRHQSLIGKTHCHYLPNQRRNHQWTMVINNLTDNDDDEVKSVNFRRHPSLNTGCSGSVAQMKDHAAGTLRGGHDDNDWTAAGRRLLRSADDTTTTSSVS